MSDFLIQAQMHAECLNEALCELFIKSPSEDRKKVIEAEMAVRVWAVIYLIQASRGSELSEDAMQVIREACAFNGPAEEFEDLPMGMH